ncbi:MAG TPA: hypothetical protein DCQ31_16955 [Bacteroidales bacterium]|nr:hypothetical protein [Bacteroidales bacterium]
METNKSDKRIYLGAALILMGAAVMASNFNILPYFIEDAIFSWQMFLILLGSYFIFTKRNKTTGFILLAVGVFFIIPELFDLSFSFKRIFWPVILVVVGLTMILGHKSRSKDGSQVFMGESESSSNTDSLDDVTIFGGNKRYVNSDNFLGGKLTSIFGGSQINLTGAKLSENGAVLDVFTLFGGSTVYVPADWNVRIDVVSIFGGYTDKRRFLPDNVIDLNKTLYIKGIAIFGGGEVKNYRSM